MWKLQKLNHQKIPENIHLDQRAVFDTRTSFFASLSGKKQEFKLVCEKNNSNHPHEFSNNKKADLTYKTIKKPLIKWSKFHWQKKNRLQKWSKHFIFQH